MSRDNNANPSLRLSKAMAHALRHRPELYGVHLDRQGWTSVDHLLVGLRFRGFPFVSFEDIRRCLFASQKGHKIRFELSPATDNETVRIRALYGHSMAENIPQIAMEPFSPPLFLFHGTCREASDAILGSKMGIMPMGRQFVHLSSDIETAKSVGRRRTKGGQQTVVLRIDAERAASVGGVRFFRPNGGGDPTLWLANSIPAEFVQIFQQK